MSAIMIPVGIVVSIGLISGVILTILSKVLFVPVDEKAAMIRDALPGANCGACGYVGCDDYAAILAKDSTVASNLCIPGGTSVTGVLAGILGVEAAETNRMVALVLCGGSDEMTKTIMNYQGVPTCKAAKQFYGGQWSCTYGCLGLGDCVTVCQYNAITVKDGLAVVNRDLCVGCGMCKKACPNNIIEIVSDKNLVYVNCHSTDPGAKTRKVCSVGCIGCGKCVKACTKFEAITIENNLAKIDFDKCKNCGLCEKECPTNAIVNLRKKPVPKPVPPKQETKEETKVEEAVVGAVKETIKEDTSVISEE